MRTLSLFALLAACTPPGAPRSPATGTAPTPTEAAAATNLSIPAARRLSRGDVIDFVLPCGGEKVYFGPFEFAQENERVELVAAASSTTGEQVCGGGEWIDAGGAFVAVAGLGCVDGRNAYTSRITNTYTPAAGGPSATPQFLAFQRSADPAASGCATLAVHLRVEEAPGGSGPVRTAGASLDPRLQDAAQASERARVLALVNPAIPDGGARTALIAIHDGARTSDEMFGRSGTTRPALEQAMTALLESVKAAPDESAKGALVAAFAATWGPAFAKLRAAAGVSTSVRPGDSVSIRDCVRDAKRPSTGGSKVEIRDCVHDSDVVYRALSLSASSVDMARPTINGVLDLAKLRPAASAIAARTQAPPFADTASQRNGTWLDHAAFATVGGAIALPLLEAFGAADQHAHATFFHPFTTGATPQVVLVRIAFSGPFGIAGLGYASVGHAAQLEVHANGTTLCSDRAQVGRYGAVFSVEQGVLSAPRFLECTIPANRQGEIAISVSSWAVAGGLALASVNGLGTTGTVTLGFTDAKR